MRSVPVRKTSSLLGHFLTGLTNAEPVLSIPESALTHVLPPSVVRPMLDDRIPVAIQSVSGWLCEIATSASPSVNVDGSGTLTQASDPLRMGIPLSRRLPKTTLGSVGCRSAP